MPNGRLSDERQRSHHESATRARPDIAARRPRVFAQRKQRAATPQEFSKVRIYGSHGEYFRELHDATREHAKGEENLHHACTAKIANGHAHALRHCVAVYRNSPRYTAESRQIRKT
ncbi:hypothetical protein [Burkholderia stabilis]|uniref:hypothetical protein n=1 Tax=Burkholderia stabilis TaxID=95485 RepID=UPI0012EA9FC1|nr:hypothetical protein [Burkholderia stabilis]HDR9490852.1 hypothetical protein [Burkholderia stabilis]HDR9525909.1 hypothetical protein [Burkholderia stabilis]HDR9531880.1 hypothetical protein [Burkholderia stabilis]HDR9535741.1 hypothetical protein [Burkholderia stabilis]HDR9545285.1 hypothetical protein [Burkholderia stabilis]